MPQLVPNQFLFRFALHCPYVGNAPARGKHVVDLPRSARLPFPGGLDGHREFGEVRVGWNENGLALQWEVRLKATPLYGEAGKPKACDGLSVWLDTRDARDVQRATKHCHRFVLMAHNGESPPSPGVAQFPIHRALENAPRGALSEVRLALFAIKEDGTMSREIPIERITNYRMEAFLPAAVLCGFDPEICSRLGFCYRLRDRELGDQALAPGQEFPYWENPSLWSTLELARYRRSRGGA